MRLAARLIGWILVPLFAAGKLAGRLLPPPHSDGHGLRGNQKSTYWSEFTRSYEEASRDVVRSWLRSEGHTIEGILESGLNRETARELTLNLMAGVREGFIDPGFAHSLTYALSCAVLQTHSHSSRGSNETTPSWPCEYCVFFKELKDVMLPDPGSTDPERRKGNKLGECERHGPISMRSISPGSCGEFTVERRKNLKLLKQTNEELQLWYILHRRDTTCQELRRLQEFRQGLKREIQEEMKRKRRRRATDYSLRSQGTPEKEAE